MTGRVAMIVFSTYPADPRVRREAEALVEAGFLVDVLCLRRAGEARRETVAGVRVRRLPLGRRRGGGLTYCWQYLAFIVLAFLRVAWLHARRAYDVVHVHNMPDVLVLSALVPKLTGARIILDLHDPMPEVYMAKYGLRPDSPVARFLKACERLSVGLADLVLTPNAAFQRLFVARGCPPGKIRVVMNSPDPRIFQAPPAGAESSAPEAGRQGGGLAVMYHGSIVERHGLDHALTALRLLRDRIPGLTLDVYGEGDYLDRFLRLVETSGLGDRVRFHGHASLERIAQAVAQADLGLIPNKRNVFTEINLPTRIFEYLSLGKPVIAPRTPGVLDYFREDELLFFEAGDADSLARAILRAYERPDEAERVRRRGEAVLKRHRWDVQKQRLVECVTALRRGQPLPQADPAGRLAPEGGGSEGVGPSAV